MLKLGCQLVMISDIVIIFYKFSDKCLCLLIKTYVKVSNEGQLVGFYDGIGVQLCLGVSLNVYLYGALGVT